MITYRLPCPLTIVDVKVDYKKVDRQSFIILLHQRNLSTSKRCYYDSTLLVIPLPKN